MMLYILIELKFEVDVVVIECVVDWFGYCVLIKEEFIGCILYFYIYQIGFGINILLMMVISFVVGLLILGQMFYIFILENLECFGVFKVIGVKGCELVMMIVFQVMFVVLVGYGLGIGLCVVFIVLVCFCILDYVVMIMFINLMFVLVMVVVIVGILGYIGVCKVLCIEFFDIFWG